MFKTFIFFIFLIYQNAHANINVKSIIKLNENIPEECGLNFIHDEELQLNASLSIKKLEDKSTQIFFSVTSEELIKDADIITSTSKVSKILKNKINSDNFFSLKGNVNDDSAPLLFQDILINGGVIKINNNSYEIKGPIDSKVRLEYLFCTGEMFLPNYQKNK